MLFTAIRYAWRRVRRRNVEKAKESLRNNRAREWVPISPAGSKSTQRSSSIARRQLYLAFLEQMNLVPLLTKGRLAAPATSIRIRALQFLERYLRAVQL